MFDAKVTSVLIDHGLAIHVKRRQWSGGLEVIMYGDALLRSWGM